MTREIRHHYQLVSDAWSLIMGDCQHFSAKQNLQSLTSPEQVRASLTKGAYQTIDALLELLAENKQLEVSSTVLDLGCGRGGAAFYLHKKFQCQIYALALSHEELLLAKQSGGANNIESLYFICSDARQCGCKSKSFSHIIMLESSLLVPDKEKMFSEIKRMLKKGGSVLFCDPIKLKALNPKQMYRFGKAFESIEKAFGQPHSLYLEEYEALLHKQGFVGIKTKDASELFINAAANWKHSAILQKAKLTEVLNKTDLQNFLDGCDALDTLLRENILGYGFIKAELPE